MIDIGMYAALGFLVASLIALMLVPALWNRAVRLTTKRLEATMPMSIADIQADKDQLRAEYAIELRRVEVALDKAKEKATRELVEANKRRVEIGELKSDIEAVKGRLQEKENANRVLEQTIRRRLPELEMRLKAAKEVISQLEAANNELRATGANQAEALKLARSTMSLQKGDIDQLRGALEVEGASSRRLFKSDSALAKENKRLSAELSKLKEELVYGKVGGKENELLSAELNKLAQQILAVARDQGTVLPEFQAPETRSTELGAPERPIEETQAAVTAAGNGGERVEPFFPATTEGPPVRDPLVAIPEPPVEEQAASAEDETEKQGSLARIMSARRAGFRGGKRRRESLSERLKNVRAEASDL
jgi:DNA repair exonuclease SbcCD ATPase subunit